MTGMSYKSFERLHSNISLWDMTGNKQQYTFSESLGKKNQVAMLEKNVNEGFHLDTNTKWAQLCKIYQSCSEQATDREIEGSIWGWK